MLLKIEKYSIIGDYKYERRFNMSMNEVNGVSNLQNFNSVDNNIIRKKTDIDNVPVAKAGAYSKKVTDAIIEQALEQSSGHKAVNLLLSNSPIGLGDQPNKEDIQNAGYTMLTTAFHHGAPVLYKSGDGSTITVYNGKGTPEMGEDKRKIVYQTERFTQEMFYDENGRLTNGKMIIKDKIAGFTEQQYDFIMGADNHIKSVIR